MPRRTHARARSRPKGLKRPRKYHHGPTEDRRLLEVERRIAAAARGLA